MSGNGGKENYTLKEYYKNIVSDALDKYKAFIEWDDSDKIEFKQLLDDMNKPFDASAETTKEKGDRLEKLVDFIISKTYFFEVFRNVHTETNEIDEVIRLSDQGKQAIHSLDLNRDLIPIKSDLFLGECKNYKSALGVTYVGKFYSLLTVSGISFGILFTTKGLTGNSEGYEDAYGLTKILRIMETARGKDFYILTFTMEDYQEMLEGTTFFDLVQAKKMEMQLASKYSRFLSKNKHAAEEQIKAIISETTCLQS